MGGGSSRYDIGLELKKTPPPSPPSLSTVPLLLPLPLLLQLELGRKWRLVGCLKAFEV